MEQPVTSLDPERQKQAKQYARIKRRLWVLDEASSLLYAIIWLVTGWSVGLRGWLAGILNNNWFIVAGFTTIFAGIYFLINLP